MATIGTFKSTAKGYDGTIATLMTTHRKVKCVPNENPKSDDSPNYFIKSGRSDLGVAWDETKEEEGTEPFEYIRVLLDGPEMEKPINAALFDREDGADLVWSRTKPKKDS